MSDNIEQKNWRILTEQELRAAHRQTMSWQEDGLTLTIRDEYPAWTQYPITVRIESGDKLLIMRDYMSWTRARMGIGFALKRAQKKMQEGQA